jgi:peptide/nickel transport system substrate-binding protein
VTSSTNPLLFVGNGGYTVSSAVDKQSVTMKKNPRYNSGPAFKGDIDTVVFRYITDGTAASQALSNGELDVYQGQVTADALAALKKIPSVKVVASSSATYEHFDTRLGKNSNDPKQPEYEGPFAAKFGAKSKALRQAFLMCVPRQEIVDKLIKPFEPEAALLGSTFTLPGSDIYDSILDQEVCTRSHCC